MSGTSPEFVAFVLEQLEDLPALAHRRLFGGVGFYSHGVQFAMVIEHTLYFVVDEQTRPRYVALGSQCFRYRTKLREVEVRKYQSVPAEWLEDRHELAARAREASAVAHRLHRPKTTQPPKPRPR